MRNMHGVTFSEASLGINLLSSLLNPVTFCQIAVT